MLTPAVPVADFYLCARSDAPDGGIYRLAFDGEKVIEKGFVHLGSSNFLCFSPDRKRLYATSNGKNGGGVAAYRVKANGDLEFINSLESGGVAACHMVCDPAGEFLYCVNYSSGNLTEFKLAADGSLASRTQIIQHEGHGPRADRQEKAHTHCTVITPDAKYLCVIDLGVDTIFMYPITPGRGITGEPKRNHVTPGDGPRHIIFDRSGNFAYVVNELGNSVSSFRYADGELTKLDTVSTLPDGCSVKTKASAIRIDENERFVYASNRGYDSIACYRVVEPGKLVLFDIVPSGGSEPRDIAFLPGWKYLAAANEMSDTVAFFSFDPVSGRLTRVAGADTKRYPGLLYILW
ncbi:MAG: lactonase family protein [Victivallaceae bacterium]|nr:lactonase family protein [Victivallaceae bacterium]